MAVTAEQSELQKAIVARVAEMQDAVKRALPSMKPVHDEFLVGKPMPSTPSEAVALGRAVLPAARQYRAILLQRGVDVAKLNHLAKLTDDLGKLVAVAAPADAEPAAHTAAEAPAPKKERKPAKKKSAK